MAQHGITYVFARIPLLVTLTLLSGCASSSIKQATTPPRSALDTSLSAPAGKHDPFVQQNIKELQSQQKLPPLTTPDYQPVSDDVSPAKTRLVNIQARNSALGDILHVIADTAGLNLIINDGVHQDRPVTLTLKRVTADDALATLLNSADYYYTIKDNTITVDATGTKSFELGHPAMVQSFNVEVGGDILGSGAALSAGGGGGGSSNVKGTISQTTKNDTKAFDFWESLEKSLQGMIDKPAAQSGKVETATLTNRTNAAGVTTTSQTKTIIEQPPKPVIASPAHESSASGEDSGPRQQIVVNRLTGTIMVTATRKNLQRIETYLDLLRKTLNRQVLVEARIIEVQLNDSLKFGIDWDFLGDIRWFNTAGAPLGGFGNVTTSLDASIKNGTFRLGYKGGNANTLLTALKTQGEVKTLSNPRINVMNGQTALLTVGRNTNYIAKVTTTTTTAAGSAPTISYSVETGNVLSGIMLGLAPFINNRGEISMTISPIISDLVKLEDKAIGGDPTNQITISIPTVDLRELSTTIKVRNGEMIVIGGLISNKQNLKDEKVPLLGEIPWLGGLFTRKDNTDTRSELVVVLQPYLINND
ncbi:MSHA biogenesis protein MshL [Trichlorobacter thiogenes]|uniref:MSHA biogenesis protein MshL n=1 Tax=Trichlorobacter thiogenes TaxID=115783 RepID=A0A1T4NTM7_9BACT|nr:MSHA biogenesis protein MshL [Trichlorobacter thiogenes]